MAQWGEGPSISLELTWSRACGGCLTSVAGKVTEIVWLGVPSTNLYGLVRVGNTC